VLYCLLLPFEMSPFDMAVVEYSIVLQLCCAFYSVCGMRSRIHVSEASAKNQVCREMYRGTVRMPQ
jgi:hypothetical protein